MASSPQQSIKNEKLNAMRIFQRNRMLRSLYHLLNLCATFFLLWHYSLFPTTFQSFWQTYSLFMPLFNNTFCAFLLLNVVILFVYLLSNKNGDTYDHHRFQMNVPEVVNIPAESSPDHCPQITVPEAVNITADSSPDHCPQITLPEVVNITAESLPDHCPQITVSEAVNIPAESSPEKETEYSDGVVVCKSEVRDLQTTVPELVNIPAESSPGEKTDRSAGVMVCKSEVGELCPNFEETITEVTETTTMMCCTRVSTTNGSEKVSEEKCYRRVQSESYDRRMVEAPKLKRCGTVLKKEPQRRSCYVEELSKDEFNRTVEDFIAKHKRMQLEEQLRSYKTEYLAIKE